LASNAVVNTRKMMARMNMFAPGVYRNTDEMLAYTYFENMLIVI
jgi:hypothetical protein